MSLVQPSIARVAVGKLRRLSRKAPQDGEFCRCLNESQVFLANDCPSVSPVCSISSASAQCLCQRESDVTNRASAVFNNLQE
jgi:hypothetical protein